MGEGPELKGQKGIALGPRVCSLTSSIRQTTGTFLSFPGSVLKTPGVDFRANR